MPKALSLLQPWASLVVMGHKKIETRSWTTAYRGTLLIHASKGKAGALVAASPLVRAHIASFNALPFGAIIGEVRLRDVLRIDATGLSPELLAQLTLEEKAFGDYTAGRYAWMLENAIMWNEFIPATGQLGLWDF
jgi:activating signal cointegrator 1